MCTTSEFFFRNKKELGVELIAGKEGLDRKIFKPEVQRPGLALTGYYKHFVAARMYVFGKMEIEYLKELSTQVVKERLIKILSHDTPAVLVAHDHLPPLELFEICKKEKIPLFKAKMPTMSLVSMITLLLAEEFSPQTMIHATLVEVFGVGVLIQGNSSVGKSEAALGLIERGHRLITDDVVKIKKTKTEFLVGYGPELTRHVMEIRGIGIINVAHLYGAVCVRPDKRIDIIVKLEPWDENTHYDRADSKESFEILDVRLPFHILPVKPGRDVVQLIETISLNHRLKEMGYNSAEELNGKLRRAMARQMT